MSIQVSEQEIENPLVSIVLPVYKVEPYLRQCMDSILNQSYKNIEVICVNDGSPDKCTEILREYAAKDDRVVIIEQVNQGVAAACNNGTDRAAGKYITYVGSDDWIEPEAIETMVDAIKKYDCDVVMFNYYREYGQHTLKKHIFDKPIIVFDEEGCRQLHRRQSGIIGKELAEPENADALCSMATKLYKLDVIQKNGVQYIDNQLVGTYGDGIFNLMYFEYVHKAVFIDRYLYHYRKTNPTSNTTAYKQGFPQKWNNLFDVIENYIDEKNLGDDFREGLSNRIALAVIGLGLNAMANTEGNKPIKTEIYGILHDGRVHEALIRLNTSPMLLHWKVFFSCARTGNTAFVYMLLKAIIFLKSKVDYMNLLKRILNLLSHPRQISGSILWHWPFKRGILSDEVYLKILYWSLCGKKLDLKNPRHINEKLQWLKLNDHNMIYSMFTDKYEVKKYIADTIGEQYVIPLLGVWDRFEDIDFDELPQKFILKCTHDSGGNVVCTNKDAFDIKAAKSKFDKWLSVNPYYIVREWQTKNIKPRIIAEEYMEDEITGQLPDYKVFNFWGEPKYIQVDYDRTSGHKRNIYSTDWKLMEERIVWDNFPENRLEKPAVLEEMLELSRVLSKGYPIMRTDFYVVNGRLYFGELTMTTGAGVEKYIPYSWGLRAGEMLDLSRFDEYKNSGYYHAESLKKRALMGMVYHDYGPQKRKSGKFYDQIQALEKLGYEVGYFKSSRDAVYYFCGDKREKLTAICFSKVPIVGRYEEYRAFYKAAKKCANRFGKLDFAYVRYSLSMPKYCSMMKTLHRVCNRVVMEIPSYPPDKEEKADPDKSLLRRFRYAFAHYYDKRALPHTDLFALIGESGNEFFGRPAVNIQNAANVGNYKAHKRVLPYDGIHILALAKMVNYHGYDRIITGLREYYNKGGTEEVYIHFVGPDDDGSLSLWRNLADSLMLAEYVTFEGPKYDAELEKVLDRCDIAVDGLGYHRKDMGWGITLKVSEFTARGIPFIASEAAGYSEYKIPFCYSIVPEDDSPVDIEKVVGIVREIRKIENVAEQMRSYARTKMSWEVQFEKIFNWFDEHGLEEHT